MSYAAVAATKQNTVSLPERVIQGKVLFVPVRNGAQRINNKSFLPIATYNSSKMLTENEEDHETSIIGYSIVGEQLQELCGRAQSTRKSIYMPGGHLVTSQQPVTRQPGWLIITLF